MSKEQIALEGMEKDKLERNMVSSEMRACKCGEMVILANRTPSQKKYGKVVCDTCERKRKAKYRKNK